MKSFFVLLMVLGMKTMHKSTFVLFLLSGLLVSCIEEFKITKSEEAGFEPNMVIEGHILSGDQSIIYVSQTVPFGTVEKPESIINALVTIIGENGYETEKLHNNQTYDYTEDSICGLKYWYSYYMQNFINKEIYKYKPAHNRYFINSEKIELVTEPENIIEEIKGITKILQTELIEKETE